MEKRISSPYLPMHNVSSLIAGETDFPLEPILNSYHIKIFKASENKKLVRPISRHADCAVCPITSHHFFVENGQVDLIRKLNHIGIQTKRPFGHVEGQYPNEARMNAVLVGTHFIYNPKSCDSNIVDVSKQCGYTLIPCKQGYTKCSVLPISKTAIITDDESIAKSASIYLDVLLVGKGDIQLSGFPYGFIGGCGTLISKDTLLFLGDLSFHRDKNNIQSFIRNYNIYAECAFHKPLQDIGSLIPVLEKWSDIDEKKKMG